MMRALALLVLLPSLVLAQSEPLSTAGSTSDAGFDPTANEVVTGTWGFSKQVVLDAGFVSNGSATENGSVVVNGDSTFNGDAGFVGHVSFNNQIVNGVGSPGVSSDATNKAYVDGLIALGSNATKGAANAVAYSNVASLSGLAATVDGVAINTDGMRVLLAQQTTASQNGLWVAHSGAWTRPTDFATGSSQSGARVAVLSGTTLAQSSWVVTTLSPNDVVDTNSLTVGMTSPGSGGTIAAGIAPATGVDLGFSTSAGTDIVFYTGGIGATETNRMKAGGGVSAVGKFFANPSVTGTEVGFQQGHNSTQLFWNSNALLYADANGLLTPGRLEIGSATSAGTNANPFSLATAGTIKFSIDATGKHNFTTGGAADNTGKSGAMTLGAITISTTAVTASSVILLTHAGSGTSANFGVLSVGTITAATSFVINSSNAADNDAVFWHILN